MPGLDAAGTLLHAGGWLLENGSSICDAGEIRVSVDQLKPGPLKADDPLYANWAADRVRKWDPWCVGIQLTDENLSQRPAPFVAQPTITRLDPIRATRDPGGRFQSWMGRP